MKLTDELDTTPAGYDHVFWAMAICVALALFIITNFAPDKAPVAGDSVLILVMAGWIVTMWNKKSVAEEKPTDDSASEDAK